MAEEATESDGTDTAATGERDAAALHLAFACAEAGVPVPEGEEMESALDEIVMAEDGPDVADPDDDDDDSDLDDDSELDDESLDDPDDSDFDEEEAQ